MTKKKLLLSIFMAIITLLIIIALLLLANSNGVLNLQQLFGFNKEKLISQKIDYNIYSFTNGSGKMLITFTDEESGIASIDLNNQNQIQCNRTSVSTDFNITEGTSYVFKMKLKNGREITDNITINEEFVENNGIKIENTKQDNAAYKIIKLTYSLPNVGNFIKQYKIGNGQWITYDDEFVIFDYDVKNEVDENQEITVYARSVNSKNENEIVEVNKKYKVDINATTITIAGESLLDIVGRTEFSTGTYNVVANGKTYGVHAYVLNGNQVWQNDMTFGVANDVGSSTEDAKNMVIVKVKGDLTISNGVTVTAYSDPNGYGGPKGLLIYSTGKITNNGTISMTGKGAKAEGEEVYIYKNGDGSFEYIPESGGTGGIKLGGTGKKLNGNNGNPGANRSTGGGGTGSTAGDGTYLGIGGKAYAGKGGTGTSYSGGGGSGSSYGSRVGAAPTMTSEDIDKYVGGKSPGGHATTILGGGAGIPGGKGYDYYKVTDGAANGDNGTGGLLIIYGKNIVNSSSGRITAKGLQGGTQGNSTASSMGGGSSGGGSINIFYRESFNNVNNEYINADGGSAIGTMLTGGAGGTGSISIGNISTGTYVSTYKNY